VSILLLGVDHSSAPLAVLEDLAVPGDDTRKVLRELVELEHVLEAVVLSTCNRVEVYVDCSRFHPGYDEVVAWLAERAHMTREELEPMLLAEVDEAAAAHLFSVASGLDSMVVGEQQIAVQVKQSMEEARAEGSAGRMLQRMFRQAVRVGRRVRRETGIDTGASSMVDVGLVAAARHLGDRSLAGHRVLVVGAGKIGSLTAARLAEEDVAGVAVWNRSRDKAERLAAKVQGTVVPAAGLQAAVADADLVVCTTGAATPVLHEELVATAVAARATGRPLVLLDLAMPRNVAPAVAGLADVEVVDVADVRAVATHTVAVDVLQDARDVVAEEAGVFHDWLRAIGVEPTIRQLRQRGHDVRTSELERLAGRLATLDDDQRQAVELLAEGIVNTLLHEPTVRLKRLADGQSNHHAVVLAELFDLADPDEAAEDLP
jgi:glutamyl-tRNA reductase